MQRIVRPQRITHNVVLDLYGLPPVPSHGFSRDFDIEPIRLSATYSFHDGRWVVGTLQLTGYRLTKKGRGSIVDDYRDPAKTSPAWFEDLLATIHPTHDVEVPVIDVEI